MLNIKDLCSCKKTVDQTKRSNINLEMQIMKNIYKRLTIAVLFAIGINANAENEGTIIVKGSSDCSSWIDGKKLNDNVQNKSWLLGYLSGLAVSKNIDILRDRNYQSIFLWMDSYCDANPLEKTGNAGEKLFNELKKQRGLK